MKASKASYLRGFFLICCVFSFSQHAAFAAEVDIGTAAMVVNNWLFEYVQIYGSWAGSGSPAIHDYEIVANDMEVLGYNFFISPNGHILVRSEDEFHPIKMYSDTDTLIFNSSPHDNKIVKIISSEIATSTLNLKELKSQNRSRAQLHTNGSMSRNALWHHFGCPSSEFQKQFFKQEAEKRESIVKTNSDFLLTTRWNQGAPYNKFCPNMSCTTGDDDGTQCPSNGSGNAVAGCVPLAVAQVMRWWELPKNTYDWANMPDTLSCDSPTSEIDAVAKLVRDAGKLSIQYGCGGTSASLFDRYGTELIKYDLVCYNPGFRPIYTDAVKLLKSKGYYAKGVWRCTYYQKFKNNHWWELPWCQRYWKCMSAHDWMQNFRSEVDAGRPVLFSMTDHTTVVDGYRSLPTEAIHINLGWGVRLSEPSYTCWYNPDNVIVPENDNYNGSNARDQQLVYVRPGTGCQFSVSPASVNFPTTASGSGSIEVTSLTSKVCRRSPKSDSPWITITSSDGSGSGRISYEVDENKTGKARTGKITVGTETVLITQGTLPISAIMSVITDLLLSDEAEQDLPTVSISTKDPTASESGGDTAEFLVARTGKTGKALTLEYDVSGSATSNKDYKALPGSVTIPSGQTSASILIIPTNDSVAELTETVTLTLSPVAGYSLASASATVSIFDDETPQLTILASKASISEAGMDIGEFTILRKGRLDVDVTAYLAISGTAVPGKQYAKLPREASIATGVSSVNLGVIPINNNIAAGNRTVSVTIQSNSAYKRGSQRKAVITIVDDEQ